MSETLIIVLSTLTLVIIHILIACWIFRENPGHSKTNKSIRSSNYNSNEEIARGMSFELSCKKILEDNKIFDVVLHDVCIPTVSGYIQIDLLGISGNNLFVIECKDYSGYTLGEANDYYIKTRYQGRHKLDEYVQYNPIYQNDTHIKVLTQALDRRGESYGKVYNVVIFSGEANIKPFNNDSPEIYSTILIDNFSGDSEALVDLKHKPRGNQGHLLDVIKDMAFQPTEEMKVKHNQRIESLYRR